MELYPNNVMTLYYHSPNASPHWRFCSAMSFAWSTTLEFHAVRYVSATAESHTPTLSYLFLPLIQISAEIRVLVTEFDGFGHLLT